MRPKIQKPIVFDNKCECLCDVKLLEKAMIWYSTETLMSKRAIYMYGNYPAVTFGGTKIHIHRLLMCHKLSRILKTDEHVHHLDGNMLNNSIYNLELTDCKTHIQGHLKGKKQDPEFAKRRTNIACIAHFGHPTKECNIHTTEEPGGE